VAEFLTTNAASYRLEQIIKNAKEKVVLVSPFVQISDNHLRNLKDADNRGVKITLIYREGKLESEEKARLDILKNLSLYCHPNLHAKCYYNENQLIITSMNLYEFSEKKNPEMGVLVQKEDDNGIYSEAVSEVESILGSQEIKRESKGGLVAVGKASEPIRLKSPRGLPAVGKASEPIRLKSPSGLAAVGKAFMGAVNAVVNDVAGTPDEGFCIRCGKAIPYDPLRPLCLDDFVKWNDWKDPDYRENCCHRCGKRRKVSMGKPLCLACYKRQ